MVAIAIAFQRPVKQNTYYLAVLYKWYLDKLLVENVASVKHCDIKVVWDFGVSNL